MTISRREFFYGASAVAGAVSRHEITWHSTAETGGVHNVRDFGATGNGISDDTAAIQASIDAFPSGSGLVHLPPGRYVISRPLTIVNDRINLVGGGRHVTEIVFGPNADATCLAIGRANGEIVEGSVRDLSFFSARRDHVLTAISLTDTSSYVIENIAVTGAPEWGGAGSVGLLTRGRELGCVRNVLLKASRPIWIQKNPRFASISLDHFQFVNVYLLATERHPCVEVEDGCTLSNVSFSGFQAWTGGSHGLYWADSSTTGVSESLVLENVRWEQGSDPGAYLIYVRHNTGLQGLHVRDCYGGLDRNGIFLRGVDSPTLQNMQYTGAGVALDADSSVRRLSVQNCFWQTGSTAKLNGQRLVFATPKSPNQGALPPTAIYDTWDNRDRDLVTDAWIAGQAIAVDDGQTVLLSDRGAGLVVIIGSDRLVATFAVEGENGVAHLVANPSGKYSAAKGTPASTNVYWSASTRTYEIENRRGHALRYRFTFVGSCATF